MSISDRWPPLRVDDWTATRDTLHMWTQIVGKIRMQHMPLISHWWQATLYVTPRGLTNGAMPHRNAVFDVEFDFVHLSSRSVTAKAISGSCRWPPNRSQSSTAKRCRREPTIESRTPRRGKTRFALGQSWIPAPTASNCAACLTNTTSMPRWCNASAVDSPPIPAPTIAARVTRLSDTQDRGHDLGTLSRPISRLKSNSL